MNWLPLPISSDGDRSAQAKASLLLCRVRKASYGGFLLSLCTAISIRTSQQKFVLGSFWQLENKYWWEKKSFSIFLAEKMQDLHRVPHVTCICAPLADEGNHSTGGCRPSARDHQ